MLRVHWLHGKGFNALALRNWRNPVIDGGFEMMEFMINQPSQLLSSWP